MITSMLGRSPPGLGNCRLAHHSSHSGTSMIASSKHTAYSGTNTCHAVVRFDGSDRSAYITTSRATADSSANQVTMLYQTQRRRPGQRKAGERQAHDDQPADEQVCDGRLDAKGPDHQPGGDAYGDHQRLGEHGHCHVSTA